MNRGLVKSFVAGAAIAANRIVKFGASDVVVQGAAATDYLLGVADSDAGSGARVDVVMTGSVEVVLGGTVTRGALLTTDANGKAVVAAAGNRVIGIALQSGVAGDIGDVLLAQG